MGDRLRRYREKRTGKSGEPAGESRAKRQRERAEPWFVIQKHAARSLHYDFRLEGTKLRGGWALQRTSGGERSQWLLIKRRDEEADARRSPASMQPESVLSGRAVEEVAEERGS